MLVHVLFIFINIFIFLSLSHTLSLSLCFCCLMQYPAGTPEVAFATSESSGITVLASSSTGAPVGSKRNAFIGSCKHQVWQAIRASSAAPYYLDDFSDGTNCTAIVCIELVISKFHFCPFPPFSLEFLTFFISFHLATCLKISTVGKMVQ